MTFVLLAGRLSVYENTTLKITPTISLFTDKTEEPRKMLTENTVCSKTTFRAMSEHYL